MYVSLSRCLDVACCVLSLAVSLSRCLSLFLSLAIPRCLAATCACTNFLDIYFCCAYACASHTAHTLSRCLAVSLLHFMTCRTCTLFAGGGGMEDGNAKVLQEGAAHNGVPVCLCLCLCPFLLCPFLCASVPVCLCASPFPPCLMCCCYSGVRASQG
jgi:hypothetical protein